MLDLILITTTIPSAISDRRLSNLVQNFNKYKIPLLIHHGNQNKEKIEILYENMLAMIDGKLNLANFCSVVDREISDLTEQSAAFNVGGVDGRVVG